MNDFGKIHHEFWKHPKVTQCSNAAIGLWSKANAFTRWSKGVGYISREDILMLGTRDEANELFNARLWTKVIKDGDVVGAQFKDYKQWNEDIDADTEAGRLVQEHIPQRYPSAVRRELARQASKLIAEGIELEVVGGALRLWLSKKLGPTLLPSLCSDVMRDREHQLSLKNTIRDCLKDGAVAPLKAYGHIFDPPIPPDGLDIAERRKFYENAKREWLRGLWEKVA